MTASFVAEDINWGGLSYSDCEHENATVTIAGAGTLPVGTVLERGTGSKYAPLSTGDAIAVLATEIEADAAGDFSGSVIINGKVRADKLDDNSQAVIDSLRDYGVLAITPDLLEG